MNRKRISHYSFYPAEHLHAHVTWRMSSSAEVNVDLNKKQNALQTQTSQVTLESACEHCKSPSPAPQEIQLNDLGVSTN